MRIRLHGEGEVGPGGGASGDLYVEVREEPHSHLRRIGNDVHGTVRISARLAATGGAVEVHTVEGPSSVDVPAGTSAGDRLTLLRHGCQDLRGPTRGDHIVVVDIGS